MCTINTKLVKYLAKCLGGLSHVSEQNTLAKCSMSTINSKLDKTSLSVRALAWKTEKRYVCAINEHRQDLGEEDVYILG